MALKPVAAVGAGTGDVVKRLLVASIAATAFFGAPTALAAPVFDWTGFYAGATLSGGWQEINGRFVSGLASPHGTSANRFWGGGHVGYQVMLPNRWVVGIEGSYSTPWDDAYATATTGPDCFTFTANRTCGSRIMNVWTAGAKIGHAFGNWMAYFAGGYANARIDHFDAQTSTGLLFDSDSKRHNGWYAGAGVDMFVTRVMSSDLILGIEYRHMEFLDRFHPGSVGVNGKNLGATVDTIMVKLTFKWVGAGR